MRITHVIQDTCSNIQSILTGEEGERVFRRVDVWCSLEYSGMAIIALYILMKK